MGRWGDGGNGGQRVGWTVGAGVRAGRVMISFSHAEGSYLCLVAGTASSYLGCEIDAGA